MKNKKNELLIESEGVQEKLTKLMSKIKVPNLTKDNCMMGNVHLNDNYEWKSIEPGDDSLNFMNVFDVINVENIFALKDIIKYTEYLIKNENKLSETDLNGKAIILSDQIRTYINSCCHTVSQEAEYNIRQLIHRSMYDIANIIDKSYPELNFSTNYTEYVVPGNNITDFRSCIILGSSLFSMDSAFSYQGANNSYPFMYRISSKEENAMHLSVMVHQEACNSTARLYNHIHRIICGIYPVSLSPEIIMNIMSSIAPVFNSFHDSIVDLFEITTKKYSTIYSNLPALDSFSKNSNPEEYEFW